MLNPQEKASLEETHQDAVFFGHNFMHSMSRMQRRHVVSLAGRMSREKVSKGAGRLQGVWKLTWGRARVPGGVQFNANTSRCRQGIDITLINVGALSFRPPPVGQVQQLLREERTVVRQISSSGEVAQEVSALAPVEPLVALWGPAAAERHR